MNKSVQVSAFMLERYHIGEITPDEKLMVERAVTDDPALAAALADLDRSDWDFRRRFPGERFINAVQKVRSFRSSVVWGLCAAAFVLVIALPIFILKNSAQADSCSRIKGVSADGNSVELSVYLKGNSSGEDIKLPDQAGVRAGNTVQLAYRVQGDSSGELYGVIFSIDGRALITMHYPYSLEQSTKLVSGKLVPLDEAYTLDDAPNYEMFFFVTADKPLEVKSVLNTAKMLTVLTANNTQNALQQGTAAFKDCGVQILTLLKE